MCVSSHYHISYVYHLFQLESSQFGPEFLLVYFLFILKAYRAILSSLSYDIKKSLEFLKRLYTFINTYIIFLFSCSLRVP